MVISRSPAGPPFRPALPWPRMEMVWPLSMPAGMLAWMVFFFRIMPLPRQSLQGWWMMRPLPPHLGQGEEVANTPMGVCRPDLDCAGAVAVRTHLRRRAGGAAACRGRCPQASYRSTVTSFSQPKAASSKLMVTRHADALAPLGGRWGWCAGRRRSRRRRSCRRCPPRSPEIEAPVEPAAEAAGAEVGVHARVGRTGRTGPSCPRRRGPHRPR